MSAVKGYMGDPESVICMVIMVPTPDYIVVASLDGDKLINGHHEMTLDVPKEQRSTNGVKVKVGRVDHKGIPHGGDKVKLTYWPTKDPEYVGKTWEWAN